jgi:NAD(P)-dependent dehydrogenase (short-subunit alcohol dehydrogenase family)
MKPCAANPPSALARRSTSKGAAERASIASLAHCDPVNFAQDKQQRGDGRWTCFCAANVDLRIASDIERLASETGDVDVLVNNAGDIPGGSLDQVDESAWRHAWDLKVFGYINLTRRIYAAMKERGGGVIINDIGAAGERFDLTYIAGSTGNAALMAFTRALGGRSLNDRIRVIGINPGPVETDRIVTLLKAQAHNRFGDEGRYAELMAHFPLGRAAKPREVAGTMVFLASARAGYTSGVVYTIDGGLCARNA